MTRALLAAAALAAATTAGAATYIVDDSSTLPGESQLAMKWKSLSPSRSAGNAVEGSSVITVRLNVAPWVGKTGRIYLVLPEQPIGQVTAEWTSQGKLLPGQLVSGNRTLVYSGPVRQSLIEDTFVLRLEADGRRLVSSQRLVFHFEIDID